VKQHGGYKESFLLTSDFRATTNESLKLRTWNLVRTIPTRYINKILFVSKKNYKHGDDTNL
jgi:hypothetical protein